MRIFTRGTLRRFWERDGCRDAEIPLRAWLAEAESSTWNGPIDVKALYRSASILRAGRIVFNIAGNKYRLLVEINYRFHAVYILFVGTHKEYDKIDCYEV